MAPIKILTSFLCLFICMKSQDYNIGFRFYYTKNNQGITTIINFVVYKDGEFSFCNIEAVEGFPSIEGNKNTVYKNPDEKTMLRAGELQEIKLQLVQNGVTSSVITASQEDKYTISGLEINGPVVDNGLQFRKEKLKVGSMIQKNILITKHGMTDGWFDVKWDSTTMTQDPLVQVKMANDVVQFTLITGTRNLKFSAARLMLI